jgi:hypothetical protein
LNSTAFPALEFEFSMSLKVLDIGHQMSGAGRQSAAAAERRWMDEPLGVRPDDRVLVPGLCMGRVPSDLYLYQMVVAVVVVSPMSGPPAAKAASPQISAMSAEYLGGEEGENYGRW